MATRWQPREAAVQGMYEIRQYQLHPGYGTVPKVIDELVAGCAPLPPPPPVQWSRCRACHGDTLRR